MLRLNHLIRVPVSGWKNPASSRQLNPCLDASEKQKPSESFYVGHILALLLAFSPLQVTHATEGIITEGSPECAYFVVKADEAYAVMEWNSENKPLRNDRLAGTFNSGSMKMLENVTRGGNVKVWVEGYPLSYDEAMTIYKAECH